MDGDWSVLPSGPSEVSTSPIPEIVMPAKKKKELSFDEDMFQKLREELIVEGISITKINHSDYFDIKMTISGKITSHDLKLGRLGTLVFDHDPLEHRARLLDGLLKCRRVK